MSTASVGTNITLETWELQTDSRIVLQVMRANRFNQPILTELVLGPERKGSRFQLSTDDRREQQQNIPDADHDPFRNGMLLRVDVDQQQDPETASVNALTTDNLIDLVDLPEDGLREAVKTLNEVACRRLLALAESIGASYAKVEFLREYIAATYMPGGPQELDAGPGERIR